MAEHERQVSKQKTRMGREAQFAREQLAMWRQQGRPRKCERCLSWLNYCRFWESEYDCQIYHGAEADEAEKKAYS